MGRMKNMAIQMDLFNTNEKLAGKIFELYEKTPNREFRSHVQFIKAECLNDAEDEVAKLNPNYWKTQSVRPATIEYAWQTFERLHFSYHTCKSLLGLDQLIGGDTD